MVYLVNWAWLSCDDLKRSSLPIFRFWSLYFVSDPFQEDQIELTVTLIRILGETDPAMLQYDIKQLTRQSLSLFVLLCLVVDDAEELHDRLLQLSLVRSAKA